jgi:hypothetical protein
MSDAWVSVVAGAVGGGFVLAGGLLVQIVIQQAKRRDHLVSRASAFLTECNQIVFQTNAARLSTLLRSYRPDHASWAALLRASDITSNDLILVAPPDIAVLVVRMQRQNVDLIKSSFKSYCTDDQRKELLDECHTSRVELANKIRKVRLDMADLDEWSP